MRVAVIGAVSDLHSRRPGRRPNLAHEHHTPTLPTD